MIHPAARICWYGNRTHPIRFYARRAFTPNGVVWYTARYTEARGEGRSPEPFAYIQHHSILAFWERVLKLFPQQRLVW